jgi:CheY-like chemotaxis protein
LDGIKLAREAKPDLILMDMIMPGMHGLEATIKLKEDPVTMDIPIMALTIMSSPKFVQECYRAGIIGYIKKPYDPKVLLDSIERIVGKPEKRVARIMMVAGEASGDLHGASLARELKLLLPDLERADGLLLVHRRRAALRGVGEDVFRLRTSPWPHVARARAALGVEERLSVQRPDLRPRVHRLGDGPRFRAAQRDPPARGQRPACPTTRSSTWTRTPDS